MDSEIHQQIGALLQKPAISVADALEIEHLCESLKDPQSGGAQAVDAIGEALKKTENLGIMSMVSALMIFGADIRNARPYFWTELERAAKTTVGPILRGLEEAYPGQERKELVQYLQQRPEDLPSGVHKTVRKKLRELESREHQGELF